MSSEGTFVTRRYNVIAGHRLFGHPVCKNIHGHNYVFEVTLERTNGGLDNGFVIDFSEVDAKLLTFCNTIDHTFFLDVKDDQMRAALQSLQSKRYELNGPPSAENLAKEFFNEAAKCLNGCSVSVIQVTCYETLDCWATYCPPMLRPAKECVLETQRFGADG